MIRTSVFVIACLVLAGTSAADNRRIVAILDVHVDGVAPEVASQFQSGLEAQVDTEHYWLAPRARVHDLMVSSTRWTDGCVVGACLMEVKTQTGAELVLLAALTGSGTSFGFVVTLVRTDTGQVLAQEAQRCDVCTVSEVLRAATVATLKLLGTVPDRLPNETVDQIAQVELAKQPLVQSIAAQHHHHNVLGVTLTLSGLGVAAAGAALYATQNHASYGLATAAAGGGLALGGLIALTF